jgi:WD40 repeat protein
MASTTSIYYSNDSNKRQNNDSNKRQKKSKKVLAEEEMAANAIAGKAIVDSILKFNTTTAIEDAVKNHVSTMDFESYALLSQRLVQLQEVMKDSRARFLDIPSSVVASNMFPYLEDRTDWNNFALVNKDINFAVLFHKAIMPPWPVGCLWEESTSIVRSPTFSSNGKFIAHGCKKGYVYVWSRQEGLVARLYAHEYENVNDTDDDNDDSEEKDEEDDDEDDNDEIGIGIVAFSPNCEILVSVGHDRKIKLWDLKIRECQSQCQYACLQEWTQNFVDSIAISPDGKLIATAGGETSDQVCLRNVSDGTVFRVIRSTLEDVLVVAFSPDGKILAVGGDDTEGCTKIELCRQFDGNESEEITRIVLEADGDYVSCLGFSPDGV